MMRVLTDDPRFTPLHHAIGHGELIDWAAVHEGSDARRRHSAMVHGLCGVGSETARLLMLCGLTRVVLNDDTPVTHEDLNTQLLLTDADVGRRRSEALAERLAVAFDGISTTEVTAMVGPLPDPESVEDSQIGVIIATTAVSSMRELADFADGLPEASCVCALAPGAFVPSESLRGGEHPQPPTEPRHRIEPSLAADRRPAAPPAEPRPAQGRSGLFAINKLINRVAGVHSTPRAEDADTAAQAKRLYDDEGEIPAFLRRQAT